MRFAEFVEINPRVKLEKGMAYPFVEMENVTPGSRYVRPITTREYKGGGTKFCSGDTVFARITPCLENGKITQFISHNSKEGFGSTEFFVFRARENISIPSFVYYLASTDIIRGPAVKSMTGASGRQRAELKVVENTEIPLFTIETQHKISSILSAYDDLIENNNRRIKILEEMAQAIYKERFINFRFPGHEKVKMVKSKLGMIPEGWEVSTVQDTFEITGGGTPSKIIPEYWEGGDINWYVPSDLTACRTMFMDESGEKISELGLRKSSARLFPAYSVMMTSRATLGVVSINTTEACTNQGFITCIPNEKFPLYTIYYWLHENVDKFISLGTGATFKEITKGVFKKIEILIPPKELLIEFENTVTSINQQVLNLQRKNINLRKTRDLLLPKLISGEIDVEEIGIIMGEHDI